jgi:formylglycine-generating enzyme required for sulfatase activity
MNYLLESTVCITVFYGLYLLIFRRLTFIRLNRIYLISALVLGTLLPLISWEIQEVVWVSSENTSFTKTLELPIYQKQFQSINSSVTNLVQNPIEKPLDWVSILQNLYILGLVLMLGKLLLTIAQILRKLSLKVNSKNYIPIKGKLANSSFFNLIFIDDSELSETEINQVLAHENWHIQLYHSYDLLFIELAKIVFWFNPILWFYQRSLSEVHEYEVDTRMIQNYNPQEYAQLLLKLATPFPQLVTAHYFSKKPLTDRINFLFNKQKSIPMKRFAYLLFIPIFGVLFMAFSIEKVVKYQEVSPRKTSPDTQTRNKSRKRGSGISPIRISIANMDGRVNFEGTAIGKKKYISPIVSQKEWEFFLDYINHDKYFSADFRKKMIPEFWNKIKVKSDKIPVINVSFEQVKEYCQWREMMSLDPSTKSKTFDYLAIIKSIDFNIKYYTFRLPTEKEWEYVVKKKIVENNKIGFRIVWEIFDTPKTISSVPKVNYTNDKKLQNTVDEYFKNKKNSTKAVGQFEMEVDGLKDLEIKGKMTVDFESNDRLKKILNFRDNSILISVNNVRMSIEDKDKKVFNFNGIGITENIYIEQSLVTQKKWQDFLDFINNDKYFSVDFRKKMIPLNWDKTIEKSDILPVINVSHEQANEYCKWRTNMINNKIKGKPISDYQLVIDSNKPVGNRFTFRLPTEKEWELANKMKLISNETTESVGFVTVLECTKDEDK